MIAPHIRMHGFESFSFASLCALLAERDLSRPREVHVLHDSGRVLSVVDTTSGRLPGTFDATDPLVLAQHLRRARGAARVVVADASSVRAAVAAVEHRVTPDWPQPALLLALQQAVRNCPGVVSDPPLPDLHSWRSLEKLLARRGDGAVVLAAGDDSGWPMALCGRLLDGLLVEVTDLPPRACQALPDLAEVAAALGERIALAMVTTLDKLRRILTAPDVAAAIVDALTGPVETR